MNATAAILPSVYLGPIQWYAKFFGYPEVLLERHEHYPKQTWRNRCRIAGPNGTQDLVIPVHTLGNHTPFDEITIDYADGWQRRHWQAIRSAYNNSPFFIFYADHFEPFYSKKEWASLLEFNTALLDVTLQLLKVKKRYSFTTEYFPKYFNADDYRKTISPKHKAAVPGFPAKRYLQVFENKHGFIPDLSILDLLCCCGPGSIAMI